MGQNYCAPASAIHTGYIAPTDLFGHPKGLFVLFFTEMWERFSYYGMRALLILYMIEALHYDMHHAAAVYGLYQGLVYLTPVFGGLIADRYMGQRRAILLGSLLMAAGHFAMCFRPVGVFYFALGLLILGNGFFKPNISVIVGKLYADDDPRRDGAFSIFYMGINIGAFLSPLICGALGQLVGWHYGFGAAGVGMVLGTLIYICGQRHLGEHGLLPAPRVVETEDQKLVRAVAALSGLTSASGGGPGATQPSLDGGPGVPVKLTRIEWQRLGVLLALGVFGNIVFWAAFEQAGSSMALFADKSTRLHLALFNFDVPSSWFQSINPLFIGLLAPLFSAMWIKLAKRQREPSTPLKFVLGMLLVSAGFGTMVVAGHAFDASGARVSMFWLVGAFFLNTCGELCLAPVGLSAVTKLAPARLASLMMGLWFGSMSIGNWLSGQLAGEYDVVSKAEFFSVPAYVALATGVLLLALCRPLQRYMHGVH
jgi:POT family proton-dependent oligopeptide transporter